MAIKKSSSSGIPFGNTAGRPASEIGRLYSNGETARLELYTQAGAWENIVQEVPSVTSIAGNYSEATNSGTITIYGTNFVNGAIATAIGSNGVQVNASSTTFNSLVQLTAVFSGLSNALEPYDIKVTNTSNLFGLLPDVLYINASPVWNTASGSLGTFGEQVSITLSALSASDSDTATITYALASGSTLPTGVSLNSSTGVISGTLPDITSDTTYSFTVNASDGLNIIPRTFSLTSKFTMIAESLVVAGGGAGGLNAGAGGGAGGLYYNGSLTMKRGSAYTLTIGNGGSPGAVATNGFNSTITADGFTTITALGGGAGRESAGSGYAGGSGGGGANTGTGGSATQPSSASGGFGFAGGNGNGQDGYQRSGAGGGGAGGVGQNTVSSSQGGAGGLGLSYSITGASIGYAGGGGGSPHAGTSGTATSGGGAGGSTNSTGFDGTANTGGGGGAGFGGGFNGGAGGSGVIVIAYPDTVSAITSISPSLTYDQPTRAGYRVYRFTAGTGTITF